MATDFWASSHHKRWILDRATLRQARADDLQYVDDPEYLDFLAIFFANLISKLGKKLQLRQRVIATATVFFRRFYAKNSYCATDPFMVLAACCYVAAKAEESPLPTKTIVTEARTIFSRECGVKTFPSDNSKLAEMEFYLVDDLECDLIVFHPYRTLMALCSKEGSTDNGEAEAGELGTGIQDAPRYWGTGEGKLELQEGALQMAWFIINDTYRSELCLIYPPHLIAITAIYLTLVLHSSTRTLVQSQARSSSQSTTPQNSQNQPSITRRSSRTSANKKQPQDIIGFMAGLNISMPLIATIAQEIISLYALWDRYKEDSGLQDKGENLLRSELVHASLVQTRASSLASANTAWRSESNAIRSASVISGGTTSSGVTPSSGEIAEDTPVHSDQAQHTVTPIFLAHLVVKMREAHLADMAHPSTGRPVAVNKMLERAQAAG